jgi:hypothetical protein
MTFGTIVEGGHHYGRKDVVGAGVASNQTPYLQTVPGVDTQSSSESGMRRPFRLRSMPIKARTAFRADYGGQAVSGRTTRRPLSLITLRIAHPYHRPDRAHG